MSHRSANALTFLACCLAVGTSYADPDHVYLESDGIVLFEVEDAQPVDGWVKKTDLDDHAGSAYLEWTGPNSFPVRDAGNGNITFHFRIQEPGNYQIRWRSHIASGESSTEHNDSWVRLATGEDIIDEHPLDGWTKVYMNTQGSWSWTSKTVDFVGNPIRQYFAQGDHTLEISGRSKFHAIDRIALYRYEDVNYNSNIIDTWELSEVVDSNNTPINPAHTSDLGPGDPDPDPVIPAIRDNLFVADSAWQETLNHQCIDNSLAVPASITLSSDLSDSGDASTEFVTVEGELSSALLKFDLSLVPPATQALIEYTTGEQAADGTVQYSLGSHSNWSENSSENSQLPDVMLQLSQASGGWDAQTRHYSQLPSELLTASINTIIISNSDGDPLDLVALSTSENAPRMVLSGDDNFCRDWQANVDAYAIEQEQEQEQEQQQEQEREEEESNKENEALPLPVEPEEDTTTSAGSVSWLALLALVLGFIKTGLSSNANNIQAQRNRNTF